MRGKLQFNASNFLTTFYAGGKCMRMHPIDIRLDLNSYRLE
jgi:hypothetical protein